MSENFRFNLLLSLRLPFSVAVVVAVVAVVAVAVAGVVGACPFVAMIRRGTLKNQPAVKQKAASYQAGQLPHLKGGARPGLLPQQC